MIDRAPRKTPRQHAAFARRSELVKRRWRQRWGYRFRKDMLENARINRARRMGVSYIYALIDDLRRMG